MLLADTDFPSGPDGLKHCLCSPPDNFPLKLDKACKDIEDQPVATGCGVNGFAQALKANPFLLKLCDVVD